MKRIKLYFEDVVNEMRHKVTWPSWKDLQSSAIVVMVASAIIAVIILAMDSSFSNLMKLIYGFAY
ncbi:MAG: preprotein translocase subunit SecE [Bacteroidetes bacterium]|nr:preprotein translocase subunit SecE [Bacteroidota bacterium]